MRKKLQAIGVVAGVLMLVAMATAVAYAGAEDWNDKQIQWQPYAEGLKEAKQSKKPICLIFYTGWCPHCANYSKLFSDPKVVEKAKSFVMIRLDKDKNADLSKQYSPDGEYIPRTYFISADGQLDASLSETRPQYKYFYSESDASSILGGMDRALKKFQ